MAEIYQFSIIKKDKDEISPTKYMSNAGADSWEPYLGGGEIIPDVRISGRAQYRKII